MGYLIGGKNVIFVFYEDEVVACSIHPTNQVISCLYLLWHSYICYSHYIQMVTNLETRLALCAVKFKGVTETVLFCDIGT